MNLIGSIIRFLCSLWTEIHLGERLGGGQFGLVHEIALIHILQPLRRQNDDTVLASVKRIPSTSSISKRISPTSSMDVPSACELSTTSSTCSMESLDDEEHSPYDDIATRESIAHQALLKGGKSMYALKVVRPELKGKKLLMATIDLACEMKMLSALNHPNILKVHATLGSIGRPNGYGIIMDRLDGTLQDKIKEWSKPKRTRKAPPKQTLHPHRESLWKKTIQFLRHPRHSCAQSCKVRPQIQVHDDNFMERLLALYDVACGMKYLHSKRILLRDLKTPNVGLKLDGGYALFDFGLSKELKIVDLVKAPDMYKATGMTGTRAFMAPEVATNQPYGFSADVFSFAMLMWEIMALEIVFPHMSIDWHYETVVVGGDRPRNLCHSIPPAINKMITQSWSADLARRPTFETLCNELYDYLSTQIIASADIEVPIEPDRTPLVLQNRLVVPP